MIQEGLIKGEHVFTLPLSPHLLFAVCSSQQLASRLGSMRPDELVTRLNTAAVRRAETHAFASSARRERLIRKGLAKPRRSIHDDGTTGALGALLVESLKESRPSPGRQRDSVEESKKACKSLNLQAFRLVGGTGIEPVTLAV